MKSFSLIFFILYGVFIANGQLGDDSIIETNALPDPNEIPTLSNGHVAFVIYGDAILLNGLYNGKGGESHRARIPNYSNILTDLPCEVASNCRYVLNMRNGYFQTISDNVGYTFTQTVYAHRFYNRAIINQVVLRRSASTSAELVSLRMSPGETPSIDLTETGTGSIVTIQGRSVTFGCFQTNEVENVVYQPVPSKVCVGFTNPPESLALQVGQSEAEYLHITTVGRTEAEVRKEMEDVINSNNILESHTVWWNRDWEKFEIAVEGDEQENKIIHGSIFYLFSNLPSLETNQPNDQFYGLSPGGLAKGGVLYKDYSGHSFWDTEMWMHPPVLLLDPHRSSEILSYRYNGRKPAADNAKNTGYNGYRFPWESAFTGSEVTPDCCPEVVEFQHHIISDIAFAFRSHLAATHDMEWFKTIGCDIAFNTARFWESRANYNTTTKLFDIRNVMGPDEDHDDIDNNAYTNVNAAINLYFGEFAACVCQSEFRLSEADYENFAKIANSLALLYDAERDYHPQYEGYNGEDIKQADAVLLGYPLQLPMDASTKRNNLLTYANVTRSNGPAMTWAMHTIGFLDIQDQREAELAFKRSTDLYTREPFKVWSEVPPGQPGATNFITGAGGFLQSVINGYGGIRLHFDRLTITNFFPTPQASALEFKGITYLNNRFKLRIVGEQATITMLEIEPTRRIKATLKQTGQVASPVEVGWSLTFNRQQELILEPVNNPFGSCQMKETVVGQTAVEPKPVILETETVVGSNELPNPNVYPTLSNGHVGFPVYGDSILMNGLYNGERGDSHRARIPNYSNLLASTTCGQNSCEYRLDMEKAFFESIITMGRTYRVIQHIYAHRFYNRAIINRIVLERLEGTFEISVGLSVQPGDQPGVDVTQVGETKSDRVAQRDIFIRCFETNVVEDPVYQPTTSKVCVAHTSFPSELKVPSNLRIAEYLHVTAVGRTEDEVRKEIQDIFMKEVNNDAIFDRHVSAWNEHWQRFGISVTGNRGLNQIIQGSMFYLTSNLPSEKTNQAKEPFYGLSPSGIGKGGVQGAEYQGHSFWDTEMWMHPPMLLLNPKWSEEILSYRNNVKKAAADNAAATGYKGYRFPWESAFTGREVTPDCCPQVIEFQQHVIADIAFAFRSHLAATHDVEWFKTVGCDIAYNTARFWASRANFNETTLLYDIRGVMGPDEDIWNVDNNPYTNVNAAINLYFGDFALCACKEVLNVPEQDYEDFAEIARRLVLLYDEEKDYHPQFEGFDDTSFIKQADTVLLGFPLQIPMNPSTKRNDLLIYDNLTREDGPAMTWAMHTIGFLDLNDEADAAKLLERSYSLYTREPFKVWSEAIPGVDGAGNFITGAGGFLQSIINGYGGVRLHFHRLTISNFFVPPFSSSLQFNGITYLNNRFSLVITDDQAIVTFKEIDREHPVKVTLNPSNIVTTPSVGAVFRFKRNEELVIEPTKNPFGTCTMKETVLGQNSGGSTLAKLGFILITALSIFAMKF